MKLIFTTKSHEITAIDRSAIEKIADNMILKLKKIDICTQPEELLPHILIAMEINEAIWRLSYNQHNDISDFYLDESIKAEISYLELYLPKHSSLKTKH